MTEKQFNKAFNTFVLVGMAVVTVLVTAIKFRSAENGQWLLVISALGSLMGVLSTVLSANGRILTFLFGFIVCAFRLRNSGALQRSSEQIVGGHLVIIRRFDQKIQSALPYPFFIM